MHKRLKSLTIICALAFGTLTALAAEVDDFLAGTSRSCVRCDLSGRDLQSRNFARTRLDQANLKNADLTAASFFRASLVRADLSGAKLTGANINVIDGKWARFAGANLEEVLLFDAVLSITVIACPNLRCA